MASTTSAFVTSLVINSAVATTFVSLFCILRPLYPKVYQPRTLLRNGGRLPERGGSGGWCGHLFGWAVDTWRMSDEDFYAAAGLDALLYTKFHRFCLTVFFYCALFGIAVLLPLNYSAKGATTCITSDNSTLTTCSAVALSGLDAISLSNIPQNDPRLWIHFLSVYLFVFITLFFLHRFYDEFIAYRLRYFGEGRNHCQTIMVRDIPLAQANTAALLARMCAVYGDQVLEAVMVLNTGRLRQFVTARDKSLRRLEYVEFVNAHRRPDAKRLRKRLDGRCGCCGGRLVDEAHLVKERIRNLNIAIAFRQHRCATSPQFSIAAFVTFRTLAAAAIASQTLFSSDPRAWTITAAPEARDVHWDNIKMGFYHRYFREWLLDGATFALILFYVIPVAFVASLTTLQQLSDRLPFLNPLLDASPAVSGKSCSEVGFLQGFLPTLALLIFMALLPTILRAMSTAQGIPALSWIEMSTMRKYFYFQVVNVFFTSLIAGSAFNALSNIISDPTSIVSLLGSAIPTTGYFFTNYVMLQALSTHPGELLRVTNLILFKIKYKFLASSRGQKDAVWAPSSFSYAGALPGELLVVLIGLTYATVTPVMLPFVVLFFFTGYIAFRHNLLHVYEPQYETGGAMFPDIFNRIMASVIIYEVTLLGIFSLKLAVPQTFLLIPPIAFTAYFWHSKNMIYERIGLTMSQEKALVVDATRLAHTPGEYRVPELNADPNKGAELIADMTPTDAGSDSKPQLEGAAAGAIKKEQLPLEQHPDVAECKASGGNSAEEDEEEEEDSQDPSFKSPMSASSALGSEKG